MNYCTTKRTLSKVDDTVPVFSLEGYKGYARITNVYDGDTFKAVLILHNRVLKFVFRTDGYDAPELKPRLNMIHRKEHIQAAVKARETFKELVGFSNTIPHMVWNPFLCRTKVNGWVYLECGKNEKYGRTLVTVFKHKGDKESVNTQMINTGLVNEYKGGTKTSFNFV